MGTAAVATKPARWAVSVTVIFSNGHRRVVPRARRTVVLAATDGGASWHPLKRALELSPFAALGKKVGAEGTTEHNADKEEDMVATERKPDGRRTSKPLKKAISASSSRPHDLVLSSGFLSFANHSGFLQAVDELGVEVGGVMGTSAGALTGALYAAGYTPEEILHVLCERRPVDWLAPPNNAWGITSLNPVVSRLHELLPATFEELERDFSCGVVRMNGLKPAEYKLVDSGPLPEAVAASAAIPVLFNPVRIPGHKGLWADGGTSDRVGLRGWRRRARARTGSSPPALVHVIQRSTSFSGDDDLDTLASEEDDTVFIRSPKSGRSLLSVGDYKADFDQVVARVRPELEAELVAKRVLTPSPVVEY